MCIITKRLFNPDESQVLIISGSIYHTPIKGKNDIVGIYVDGIKDKKWSLEVTFMVKDKTIVTVFHLNQDKIKEDYIDEDCIIIKNKFHMLIKYTANNKEIIGSLKYVDKGLVICNGDDNKLNTEYSIGREKGIIKNQYKSENY